MGKSRSGRGPRRVLTPSLDRHIRGRIRVFAAVVAVVCFGGLLARLFVLQILDPDNYADRAAGQQLRDTTLPAARGEIISADGVVLATSKTCWTIRASPRELDDAIVEPAARALSEILELDYDATLEKLSQRSSNDCLLRRRVDADMANAVRTWCAENGARGIQVLQDTKRVYPEGDFMGCLLGFTDVDNQGLWGLELAYDEPLTGQNGVILTAKNAWGYDMPTHYSTLQEAVPGSSLTLTIRDDIQHYLESALCAAVEEHNVASRAVGIVMDVNTGAVLAMSTKPDYDPNNPRVIVDETVRARVNALTGEERSAALQTAQQAQWRNKAISDLYEPGSVFKLITCSAALDTGAVTRNTTFVCAGKIGVAGTTFRCANGHVHGSETVAQGLAVSCNPCFIQIGARLGKENFCKYFEAFGLRTATGIDLPGEIKRSEYYTADRMGPVELASCSFGQSSKVSYLQMITAVCAVVNGGKLMQPYVVQTITDADGQVTYQAQPTVKAQVIKEETSAVMRELMEGVVTSGTGKNAAVAGYRVGGKSGTSQKLDSENERARIASFVAVAPIENPQIAVLVCLDEPHSWTTSGGALSGPVCAEVLQKSLPRLGIEPSYNEEEQKKYFTTVPDVTGWRTAAAGQKLAEYSLTADVLGEGERVQSQYPAAGTSVRKNSAIQLDTTGTLDPAADE
ncbi:MAG: penicillin-binding transpeptidase domain-containing protein [Gemmiger sp.]|uniref:penicillin-binding transpeptidase domain-containing protein n=1 Tax=Gemmiger sp. TaxID=2049027 RepID=UPI002A7FD5EA|nr:penicillin-binding transpeptidase domain-containing protein [Gemmiger sp.]MDY4880408.1 penicillin-binding transpeptidase domain-containing protein [Gemmiger sp.]